MSRATSEGLVVVKMPSAMLLAAEVRSVAARRALSAELLGTLLPTFFTAGAVLVTGGLLGERLSPGPPRVTALAPGPPFRLPLVTMGGLSARPLNPRVTLRGLRQ